MNTTTKSSSAKSKKHNRKLNHPARCNWNALGYLVDQGIIVFDPVAGTLTVHAKPIGGAHDEVGCNMVEMFKRMKNDHVKNLKGCMISAKFAHEFIDQLGGNVSEEYQRAIACYIISLCAAACTNLDED